MELVNFEIIATAGIGYNTDMIYNYREGEWKSLDTYRGDGTTTTINSREEAEAILRGITDLDGLRNVRINEIVLEIEED